MNELDTAGASNSQAVTMLRISLMDSYMVLRPGGSSVPTNPLLVAAIKVHLALLSAKTKYALFEVRTQAAEKNFNGCSFGYQMADGGIRIMDLDGTSTCKLKLFA